MRALPLLLMLCACVPHPLDRLDRSGRAEAGGHAFRVNWNVTTAQVTRTDPAWRPRLPEVTRAAVAAAEVVTGCVVDRDTVSGDVALVNMGLDCRGLGADGP